MSYQITRKIWRLLPLMILFAIPTESWAQAFERASQVTSPEVSEERSITFRIFAPTADSVKLSSSDLPGFMGGQTMQKDDEGVWSITIDPVSAGAYRYNFNVDGVATIDPRNPSTSEANENTWSLVVVPGNEMMDTRDVPHGAVAEVTYHSESLDKFRRMHIYTPPGYETGDEEYPVFYLLHGAFDSDDAWSTVGRAGFILDNLIAAGKAKPMIMVMPDGHTGPFSMGDDLPMDEFLTDFQNDIRPYIESNYRVLTDRKNRAMAGLSMGGGHTLNLAIPNLNDYAYIGVFSSGVFELGNMGGNGNEGPSYMDQNEDVLNNDDLKEGLELFWFGIGKDDFLLQTSDATVEMFKNHGFDVEYKKTSGGHTWLNWRDYLIEFAPRLFQ